MKFRTYTDAEFAPNESIKKKQNVSYAEVENEIYHKSVGKTKMKVMIPFLQEYICNDWKIKMNVKSEFEKVRRILLRSVVNN